MLPKKFSGVPKGIKTTCLYTDIYMYLYIMRHTAGQTSRNSDSTTITLTNQYKKSNYGQI